jgi:hypothetical protein
MKFCYTLKTMDILNNPDLLKGGDKNIKNIIRKDA